MTSSDSINACQSLKKDGNTKYAANDYKSALALYEQSLQCINIALPALPDVSLLQGTDTEYYKHILQQIELNRELQANDKRLRHDISKIFSNRAACFLNLKQWIECVHASNIALLYHPSNESALYRRALSYEYLQQYVIALVNYQKCLQISAQNQKALEGLKRVKAVVDQKKDRVTMYTEAMQVLSTHLSTHSALNDDEQQQQTVIRAIGVVMRQLYHSAEYHDAILNRLGFTHILSRYILSSLTAAAADNGNDNKFDLDGISNVHIECVRALNAVLKHITCTDKFSQANQLLVSNAFVFEHDDKTDVMAHLIRVSKQFLSTLIRVLETKETTVFSDKLNSFMQRLLEFLVSVASNQYLFATHSDAVFNHLVEYFKRLQFRFIRQASQRKLSRMFKVSPPKPKSKDSKVQAAAEDGDERKQTVGDEHATQPSFITLQYEEHLQQKKKKKSEHESSLDIATTMVSDVLVTILTHLSNTALRNNTGNYELLEKIRYVFFYQFLFSDFSKDLRIKTEIVRYFVCCSGLKSVFDQVNDTRLAKLKTKYESRITEALATPIVNALKTKRFGADNLRLHKALRGLSIILQSHHKLGAEVASKEDVLNCIVEVATLDANDGPKESPRLHDDNVSYLGCEVLALSCSTTAIRDAIISSNNQHVFAWILDAPDLMVRAYAANALSKFAAIDEDSRELALGGPDRCLYACCAIIHYLLQHETRVINTKSSAQNLYGTAEQTNARSAVDGDGDEQYKNYKLPLMNLCVETVSYLSLHIETKLAMIRNQNEVLKILVSIASTRFFLRNRSLRHGLLTTILNCSLSSEDVNRYMNEKEEQLVKLRKVVSKGLPRDPTKQDDIIQSRAGDKANIKLVQCQLIKENCIFLIFNIVKFTNQENEKIDAFVNDEIGMSETDQIRFKQREEERRRERYHWDPDKHRNQTEKDKLQRKTLTHKNTQRVKYRSFELEEKLQMKICQVLMMMSAEYEFRGSLVQQKAVRLCMDLFFQNKHKVNANSLEVRQMASACVARICISINPVLLNVNDVKPITECLLRLVDEAQHQLYVYEALLALCNLSSMDSDDIKMDIAVHKKGWGVLRNALEDDHDLINAAILENWCNLCTCFEAGIVKLWKNKDVDVQIATLFLQHDDRRIQRAAVSILALATSVEYDGNDDEDEDAYGDIAKEISAEVAKNGGVMMLQCLLNIRQSTLIERFNENERPENRALDQLIIERVRMVLGNLEKYGYTMRNLDKHGMRPDVLADFEKYLKK